MRNLLCILCISVSIFLLLGCKKADVRFVSYAKARDLGLQNARDLHWSIAMSKGDIVRIVEQLDVEYNTTTATNKHLYELLIFNWVKTGEEATAEIEPGVYDWLIVMSYNGRNCVDGYYGTDTSQIKLRQFRFEGGKNYKIVVHDASRVELSVE